jgi:hypothetical protein
MNGLGLANSETTHTGLYQMLLLSIRLIHTRAFYAQYGFILLPDRGLMFLPMNMIKQIF